MSLLAKLVEEIKNDKITNKDLIICLEAENLRVVAMAMFKIIERNYCDRRIINRLIQLGKLLKGNKFVGTWQFGHVAIATLFFLDNDDAKSMFNELFNELNDTDKFLVNNFIKSEAYKL